MRHGLLLGGLLVLGGAASAQSPAPIAPVAPITSLGTMLETVRAQTYALGDWLTGERLTDPVILHDIGMLLDATALTVHEMATHAEHGQITDNQRALLQAQVDKVQLQLERLTEALRDQQLR